MIAVSLSSVIGLLAIICAMSYVGVRGVLVIISSKIICLYQYLGE